MPSSIREGNDFIKCIECREQVNLNDPDRYELPGGKFQPHCKRCAYKLEQDGKLGCINCGEIVPISSVQFGWHTHHTTETTPVAVCSQQCTIGLVLSGASSWDQLALGSQYEPPTTFDQLATEYHKERTEEDIEAYKTTVDRKYIALSAAYHLQSNRREVVVDTRLTHPDSGYLPLVISPKWETADDEYVTQFHHTEFNTPLGDHRLLLDDPDNQHQAFGVCLFNYQKCRG